MATAGIGERIGEHDNMPRLTIFLKGGNSFEVSVDSYTTYKNGLGEFARFAWDGASPGIVRLDVDEIQAILDHG